MIESVLGMKAKMSHDYDGHLHSLDADVINDKHFKIDAFKCKFDEFVHLFICFFVLCGHLSLLS